MNKTTFAAITLVLGSVFAGQAFAADADAKPAEQHATATQAAPAQKTSDTISKFKSGNTADAFAELDKIKKW